MYTPRVVTFTPDQLTRRCADLTSRMWGRLESLSVAGVSWGATPSEAVGDTFQRARPTTRGATEGSRRVCCRSARPLLREPPLLDQ